MCRSDVLPILYIHKVFFVAMRAFSRICIGIHVANQALFIDIASMLWGLNIEKAVDASGSVIVPSRTAVVDEGVVT